MAIPYTDDGGKRTYDLGELGGVEIESVNDGGETDRISIRLDGPGVTVVNIRAAGGHIEVKDEVSGNAIYPPA